MMKAPRPPHSPSWAEQHPRHVAGPKQRDRAADERDLANVGQRGIRGLGALRLASIPETS
jgi:hypothetical protein